jgi:hypothetical protein
MIIAEAVLFFAEGILSTRIHWINAEVKAQPI